MTTTTDAPETVPDQGPPVPARRRLAVLGFLTTLGILGGLAWVLDDPEPVGVPGQWDTAFEEEFSGDGLDRDRWSDHEAWQADGYAIDDAWAPVPHERAQLEVRDGELLLKARRAEGLPEGKTFTSASVHTRDRFTLPKGETTYVEARLKAPSGKGLLPAFWLLGNGDDSTGEGWPINGEIDILEFANNEKESGRPFFSVWYPRDVYENPPGTFLNGTHDTHPDSFEAEPALLDSWHVWGLYRSPEKMDIYIDGVKRFTFRPGEVHQTGMPLPDMLFENDMHLRLSLAVGGDWAGDGWSPEEYEEGDLAVDYVRAWTAED